MAAIIEELKARLNMAVERHNDAQKRAQAAQAEFQASVIEYNAWKAAYELEMKAEAIRLEASTPADVGDTPHADTVLEEATQDNLKDESQPVNKTETVREILRQHPLGLDSGKLWNEFQEMAPGTSRPYLYSILKRLRDRDHVCVKRGKYMLKMRQDVENPSAMIQ